MECYIEFYTSLLNIVLCPIHYQNKKFSRVRARKTISFLFPFMGYWLPVSMLPYPALEKRSNRSFSCKWSRPYLECPSREGANLIYTTNTNTKVGRSWIAAVKRWADVDSQTMGRLPYSSWSCYSSVVPGHFLEMSRNTYPYLHTWKVEKHCSWQTKISCTMEIEVKM